MIILGPNTESKIKIEMLADDYAATGYYNPNTPLNRPTDNFIWAGDLRPRGYTRGRSSVRFTFIDDVNRTYEMSPNNVAKLLELFASGDGPLLMMTAKGKAFCGRWTFAKEGQNVSLVPLPEVT